MFKFMNRRPHVYLLSSDKYPNNVKISHSSLMNLCTTFCAPGQYFFRQNFSCTGRGRWGGGEEEGAYGAGGSRKQEFSCLVNTRIMRRELFPAGRAAKTRRARRGQRPRPHVGNVIGLQCEVFPSRRPLLPPPSGPPAPPPHPCPLGKPARSRRASRLSERESAGARRTRAADVTSNRQTPGQTEPKGRPAAVPDQQRRSSRTQPAPQESEGGAGSWNLVTNAQPLGLHYY